MNKLFFWNDWDQSDNHGFKILSIASLVLIVSVLVIELGDINFSFDWLVHVYMENQPIAIFTATPGLPGSQAFANSPIIFQKFSADFVIGNPLTALVYLSVFYFALIGCLTVATYLKKFWFVFSMGLFILLIAFGGFSGLGIFGNQSEMVIAAIALPFVGLAYYFSSIKTYLSFGIRLAAFVGLGTLLALMIGFLAGKEAPFLFLAYHAFMPSMIISIVFVLLVSHEIIYAILNLATQESEDATARNTLHFLVLSLVYLCNVILLYLRSISYIAWDIYYFNAFLVLSTSAILGLWGLKNRENLYGSALSFDPHAAFLYVFLSVICFSTILFQSIAANDPALEAIEDAIIFGHIGFGCMFFFYIISNFISLMTQNLPVHKVAFKEDNFPYVTYRLAGAIVVAAFFFGSNYAAFDQAVAGFYNGLADAAMMRGQQNRALFYYKEGYVYSSTNHKSNLMLGMLNEKPEPKIRYIKRATEKNATPFSYVNLGYVYEQNNQFFEAVFAYQKGLDIFPNDLQISNNLALLYNKTKVTDSSIFYLQPKRGKSWMQDLLLANMAGVSALHDLDLSALISEETIQDVDRVQLFNNALIYDIKSGNTPIFNLNMSTTSSQLNLMTYAYLMNWGLWSYLNNHPDFLQAIDPYLRNPSNNNFSADLTFIKGLNLFAQRKISDAFETMNKLANESLENNGIFYTILGKWSMNMGSPKLAAKYAELARASGYPDATVDLARAYGLTNNGSVAQFILSKELESLDDQSKKETWEQMIDKIANNALAQPIPDFSIEEQKFSEINNRPKTNILDAMKIEQLAKDNPFFEKGVLAAVHIFKEQNSDNDRAYQLLLEALNINEYSEILIKAYIDQCFEMGLFNYAESSIISLIDILDKEAYDKYELEFEEKNLQAQAKLSDW